MLGHKSIKNTVKYTHLVHFRDDEFDIATATTVEETKDLARTGFEYFTTEWRLDLPETQDVTII